MNRPVLCLVLLSTLLAGQAPLAGSAGREIHESAEAHPRGEVEVSNVAGRIEIEGWEHEKVEVTGTLGHGVERLEFRTQGRHTLIRVEHGPQKRHVGASELRIRVPLESRLTVGSVSADVLVREVQGAQRMQSVSGDIDTRVFGEDVQLKTVSGVIRLQGSNAPAVLTATTVSGNVTAQQVAGEVVMQTVSGDLEVDSELLERARLRTTNGAASLRTGLAAGARVEMEAVNGTLTLTLLGEPDAEFTLESFNGRIDNDFGPEPVRTSRYAPGREARFTTGEGSARVNMETLNGSIILRKE
jgi:DUF4097 and DUF4098 domain-containing protein YvlB